MSEDYDQIPEAEELNMRTEEYLNKALEEAGYGETVERYEGSVGTSLGDQELERGRESVDAMLEGWKNANR